jgi:hypothetical protein
MKNRVPPLLIPLRDGRETRRNDRRGGAVVGDDDGAGAAARLPDSRLKENEDTGRVANFEKAAGKKSGAYDRSYAWNNRGQGEMAVWIKAY